jgi:hypothetical protein
MRMKVACARSTPPSATSRQRPRSLEFAGRAAAAAPSSWCSPSSRSAAIRPRTCCCVQASCDAHDAALQRARRQVPPGLDVLVGCVAEQRRRRHARRASAAQRGGAAAGGWCRSSRARRCCRPTTCSTSRATSSRGWRRRPTSCACTASASASSSAKTAGTTSTSSTSASTRSTRSNASCAPAPSWSST